MKAFTAVLLPLLLFASPIFSKDLTVMAYNVENLFDTQKDKGKEDYAFLPRKDKSNPDHIAFCETIDNPFWKDECLNLDWSNSIYTEKIHQLARVLRAQKLPDILILEEVENKNALEDLNKYLGYTNLILIEGNDTRGIDVAILTNFKSIESARLHAIPFEGMDEEEKKDTRGILEARLKGPKGKKIQVFAVHFPAPYHPVAYREQAARFISTLKKPKKFDLSIAGGDFNITNKEDPYIYRGILAAEWKVSHLESCHQCLGTQYYGKDKSWSFLDAILVSGDVDSIEAKVIKIEGLNVGAEGRPFRFNKKTGFGVSDHLPIHISIDL